MTYRDSAYEDTNAGRLPSAFVEFLRGDTTVITPTKSYTKVLHFLATNTEDKLKGSWYTYNEMSEYLN